MTVYGTMQCPTYVHDAVADAIGVDRNKVRVIQTTTGGGFGGKEDFPSVVSGEAAIVAKDKDLAQSTFLVAESELMKAVNKELCIVILLLEKFLVCQLKLKIFSIFVYQKK